MSTPEGQKLHRESHYFEIMCILVIAAVLVFPLKRFVLDRNFSYIVEVPCDAQKEACLYRDCAADECPPNQLSDYKRLRISAKDFEMCQSESCYVECQTQKFSCEPEE